MSAIPHTYIFHVVFVGRIGFRDKFFIQLPEATQKRVRIRDATRLRNETLTKTIWATVQPPTVLALP